MKVVMVYKKVNSVNRSLTVEIGNCWLPPVLYVFTRTCFCGVQPTYGLKKTNHHEMYLMYSAQQIIIMIAIIIIIIIICLGMTMKTIKK